MSWIMCGWLHREVYERLLSHRVQPTLPRCAIDFVVQCATGFITHVMLTCRQAVSQALQTNCFTGRKSWGLGSWCIFLFQCQAQTKRTSDGFIPVAQVSSSLSFGLCKFCLVASVSSTLQNETNICLQKIMSLTPFLVFLKRSMLTDLQNFPPKVVLWTRSSRWWKVAVHSQLNDKSFIFILLYLFIFLLAKVSADQACSALRKSSRTGSGCSCGFMLHGRVGGKQD